MTVADVGSWDVGTKLIADSVGTLVDIYPN
jgi:hypothetical protein